MDKVSKNPLAINTEGTLQITDIEEGILVLFLYSSKNKTALESLDIILKNNFEHQVKPIFAWLQKSLENLYKRNGSASKKVLGATLTLKRYSANKIRGVTGFYLGAGKQKQDIIDKSFFVIGWRLRRAIMNDLQLFSFKNKEVRIVITSGEPWFVAKDICEVLNIAWRGKETLSKIPDSWIRVRCFRTLSRKSR